MRFLRIGLTLCLMGCGAKTGLLIPDADLHPDAGMDGGFDAGIDAPICRPTPVTLRRRGAQVMFAIDRSNSMDDTIAGDDRSIPPFDRFPSRWEIFGEALGDVLSGGDPLLEIGAKFYPAPNSGGTPTPELACAVDPGIDLMPARGNVARLLSFFTTTEPAGGTPTAVALAEVERFFGSRPAPGVPRFVVLATDGGPNCNGEPDLPPGICLCTGPPDFCTPDAGEFAPYNCLDRERTLETIGRIAMDMSIPVYVIGIENPTRPDLARVLDDMAEAGTRPRVVPGERAFYSVESSADVEEALTTITETIARCVFEIEPVPTLDATLEVSIDGLRVAQDGTRSEGWDFTAVDRSEITLFGGACARVTETEGEVTAEILCDE